MFQALCGGLTMTRLELIQKYNECTTRAQVDMLLHAPQYKELQFTPKKHCRERDFEEQCQIGAARLAAYRRVGK